MAVHTLLGVHSAAIHILATKHKAKKTMIKKKPQPTGMSYHKTAYVGIGRRVTETGAIRYRVKHGREVIATGAMTMTQALEHLSKAQNCRAQKKAGAEREDIGTFIARYKIFDSYSNTISQLI